MRPPAIVWVARNAYGVGVGRDEGGRQSLEGRLDEIDTDLARDATSSTCAGAEGWCDTHSADWMPGEHHCEAVEF